VIMSEPRTGCCGRYFSAASAQSTQYTIRIEGHLDAVWGTWFDGMTLTHDPNGETVLTGAVPDQAALHGILLKIRDMHLVFR
jgi:hypothetical protein